MLGKLSALSVFVGLVSYVYFTHIKSIPSPIVKIPNGKIQGVVSMSRNKNEYYSYMGIPYGKSQRFESPKPIREPWPGILDASQFSIPCLQYDGFVLKQIYGSEDCLSLNVFTPKNAKNLAVMVYIHGGLFHVGGPQTAGPSYLMDENVIMVSVQYRLGVLGFMNSGDGRISGNFGLKDQNLALRWVQDNIVHFGGDPNKVTIFGESAGAAAVDHHVVSHRSKGLFKRAIHQSGSASHYWSTYRNVKQQAKHFAKKVGCPTENPKEMVQCMKNMDGRSLLTGHWDFGEFPRTQISVFAPSIEVIKDDDAFITEEPSAILQSGRFNRDLTIMTGCNSDEGLLFSSIIMANQTKLNEANDEWDEWAPKIIQYPKELKNVTNKIRKFYFGDATKPINSSKFMQNYTNLLGDRIFNIATSHSVKVQSEFVPTYVYYFDHQGGFSLGRIMAYTEGRFHFVINLILGEIKRFIKISILGQTIPHISTCHGDEIGLLFSGALTHFLFNKETDDQISRDMVKLWADFAKGKKPLKFRNIEWPVSTKDSLKFLRISNKPAIINEPFEERRRFFETLHLPLA